MKYTDAASAMWGICLLSVHQEARFLNGFPSLKDKEVEEL